MIIYLCTAKIYLLQKQCTKKSLNGKKCISENTQRNEQYHVCKHCRSVTGILFPYIHTLLRIACTLPVTSCECERSCSVLRRLSNYTSSTMGQDRLTSLALMNIHYAHDIDLDMVVKRFCELHPRRLEMTNLIFMK